MRKALICIGLLAGATQLPAQLPPDAVDLAKVKISEQEKPIDLCPVHLVPSVPGMPTWDYRGTAYRGHEAGCETAFADSPARFAAAAMKQRWLNNFMAQMSNIWCPVTDDIAPGGMTTWEGLGYTWESCCAFCDADFDVSDLPGALERLKARAAQSYELTGGRYVEGASSPVAGAIAGLGGAVEEPVVEASLPTYLADVDVQPTYNGGVGLIFEQRCVECHRPGGEAPMAFTSYGEIRRWTRNMKLQIGSRSMPPWPADPEVGEFANDRQLSELEYETLLAWADAGFPAGEGEYQPTPSWSGDWGIGEPDHVFTLPDHTVAEDVSGEFAEFTIKTDFPEDRWIIAAEGRPGDPYLVFAIDAGPLGSYHPGSPVQRVPEGTGYLLESGAEITVRVHYADKGTGFELTDTGTQLGVVFADGPRRVLHTDPMAATGFRIPARDPDVEVVTRFTMPADGEIRSLMPVMMKRGKSVRYDAILPGGERHPLLSVPRWNPMHKTRYWLKTPLEAPKGTVIEATAHFDNSTANPDNPDPSAVVESGPAGELFEGWVGYTLKSG